ncbi:condensation domain-containing protein [Lentzea sp. NPDC006480]|uniref:condensation domain-containing protein n=1 Tax=Lentzea sp. NPDC006480 TaxID=3157176 RepID=UPI0033B1F64B
MNDSVARLARLTPEQRARLVAKARQSTPGRENRVPRADPAGPIPASFAQEQLWFLSRLVPGVPNYNVPFRFAFDGPLDAEALTGALNDVIERHDALRTTLEATPDGLRQIVHPHLETELAQTDLSGYEEPDTLAATRQFELARTVFDLEKGPLWTAELQRLADQRHVLVWVASHTIADGGSIGVVVEELAKCYTARVTGTEAQLDPNPVQLGDFATWQKQEITGDRAEELLGYWREQVRGYAGLGLSYDHPKRPGLDGRTIAFQIEPSTAANADQLAKKRNSSVFMVLLAAYQVLLMRLSGRDDIAVATPLAGRDQPEFERVAGSLTNTVVLRASLADNPEFGQLVDQVRDVTFDALKHADLPFGKLVAELKPARNGQSNPITQTIFSYGGTPMMRGVTQFGPDVRMRCDGMSNGTVRFDFELVLDEKLEGLSARFEYNADWIDQASAELICQAYQEILAEAVRQPEQKLDELPEPRLPDWEPEQDIPEQERRSIEDVSPLEEPLAQLWAARLEVEQVGRDDDFFVLGGHSFLATELVADINAHLGSRLTVLELFQTGTVASLAQLIEEMPAEAPDPEPDLAGTVESMSDAEVAAELRRLRSRA